MRDNIVMTSINYVRGTRTQRVVGRAWRRPAVTQCVNLDDHADTYLHLQEPSDLDPWARLAGLGWLKGCDYGRVWNFSRQSLRLL